MVLSRVQHSFNALAYGPKPTMKSQYKEYMIVSVNA